MATRGLGERLCGDLVQDAGEVLELAPGRACRRAQAVDTDGRGPWQGSLFLLSRAPGADLGGTGAVGYHGRDADPESILPRSCEGLAWC